MSLTLAIDQGTHASRARVVDDAGRVLATGERDIGLVRPQPDWAEQDGEEAVASIFAAAEQALAALDARKREVARAGERRRFASYAAALAAGSGAARGN